MSRKPETIFRQGQVMPFLKTLKNTMYFSIQQVAILDDPDIVLCMRGKFVALELKARGERPRPLQRHKLNRVEEAGGFSLVADPDNWERIKKVLTKLDQGGKLDAG